MKIRIGACVSVLGWLSFFALVWILLLEVLPGTVLGFFSLLCFLLLGALADDSELADALESEEEQTDGVDSSA